MINRTTNSPAFGAYFSKSSARTLSKIMDNTCKGTSCEWEISSLTNRFKAIRPDDELEIISLRQEDRGRKPIEGFISWYQDIRDIYKIKNLNNGRFFEIEGNNMTQFLKNIIAREKEIFSKEVTFEHSILNALMTKSDVSNKY